MFVVEYDLQDKRPQLYGPFNSHKLAFWWVKSQPWFHISNAWDIRQLLTVV